MSSDKSFHQILKEKMQRAEAPEIKPKKVIDEWWNRLNIEAFRRSDRKNVHQYEAFQKEFEKEEVIEEPIIEEKTEPTIEVPEWDFHQQLAIQQLISLGANLSLKSSFDEVKKAYRLLIQSYHPDRHQNADELTLKRMEKRLGEVVEAYRLFNSNEAA